jgi:hypothetical protein
MESLFRVRFGCPHYWYCSVPYNKEGNDLLFRCSSSCPLNHASTFKMLQYLSFDIDTVSLMFKIHWHLPFSTLNFKKLRFARTSSGESPAAIIQKTQKKCFCTPARAIADAFLNLNFLKQKLNRFHPRDIEMTMHDGDGRHSHLTPSDQRRT